MNVAGWVALVAMTATSIVAAAAVARAKGRGLAEALVCVAIGPLGLLLVAVRRPQMPDRGRLDWLLGRAGGTGAAWPAILLSCVALVTAGLYSWGYATNAFASLDDARIERAIIKDRLAHGVHKVHVNCPDRMSAARGSVNYCEVTMPRGVEQARVTVMDDAGYVTWTYLPG